MSFLNFFAVGKKGRLNRKYARIIICIFFILMFALNFLNFNNLTNQDNDIEWDVTFKG